MSHHPEITADVSLHFMPLFNPARKYVYHFVGNMEHEVSSLAFNDMIFPIITWCRVSIYRSVGTLFEVSLCAAVMMHSCERQAVAVTNWPLTLSPVC